MKTITTGIIKPLQLGKLHTVFNAYNDRIVNGFINFDIFWTYYGVKAKYLGNR